MILNIYKQKGWTSFDVVAKLKGILGTKKIGHAGTLDPLAEGVLIILTHKDTKKQNEHMHTKKEYIADIALGLDSDSYDLETLLRESIVPTDVEDLPKYIGFIIQTVPPYSAIKVSGRRLYKSARSGNINKESLPSREVEIFELEKLEEYKKNFGKFKNITVIKLKIVCSSGFYVRSFAHDIGGVLVSLIRTKVGNFDAKDAVIIDNVPTFN